MASERLQEQYRLFFAGRSRHRVPLHFWRRLVSFSNCSRQRRYHCDVAFVDIYWDPYGQPDPGGRWDQEPDLARRSNLNRAVLRDHLRDTAALLGVRDPFPLSGMHSSDHNVHDAPRSRH